MSVCELQKTLFQIYGKTITNPEITIDDFLEKNQDLILTIDWSGEDDADQLETFICKNFNKISKNKLLLEPLHIWELENKETQFHRGEYIINKIILIGKILLENEVELIIINNNTDLFNIFILPQNKCENLFMMKKCNDWYIESFRDLINIPIRVNPNITFNDSTSFKKQNNPKIFSWFLDLPFSDKLAFIITFTMIFSLVYFKL